MPNRAVNFFPNEAEDLDNVEVGRNDLCVGDGSHLAAGIEVLSKAGHAGISVGRDAGIVLVIILQSQRVLGVDDPVEVTHRLIRQEISSAGGKSVFRKVERRSDAVVPRHQVLAVREFVLKYAQGDRINLVWTCADGSVQGRAELGVGNVGQAGRYGSRGASSSAVGRVEAEWNGHASNADLLIGTVNVLVAEIGEQFVLDDRRAPGSAQSVAMLFGNFQVGGKIGILVKKERGGVEPVRSAMQVGGAVDCVGARGGAHVNVRAAGGALLRVVHRSIDANLLNGFRGGSG